MTCCIVGLAIMMVLGRLRRVFGGRDETPVLFAPVAQRPAPGQMPALVVEAEPVSAGRPVSANVLRSCAFGIVVCLIGTPVLVWAGAVANTGSATGWLLRSACYLAVIAAAMALSRSGMILRAPAGVGTTLIIVGVVVFELGIIDMHVFRVINIDSRDMLAYMLFHNIGPVLAMAGGLILLYGSMGRTASSRRSSRSTVTIAQPLSSAVTVSSTPPITA
jgi:hypothetical protein